MRVAAVLTLVLASLAPVAAGATADASTVPAGSGAEPGVRIVNLNLLHGVFCEPESNLCQAEDRVALLGQQLEASGCPEVVGLQEINQNHADIIAKARKTLCGGDYEIAFGGKQVSLDTELVLTTLPIKSTKVIKLVGGFRTASRVVLGSDLGPLVVVVTHQDGDREVTVPGCMTCKPPCSKDEPILQCQTVAALALSNEGKPKNAVRVLMGDFNLPYGADRYNAIIADGYVDSYLEAGNPECDPLTGVGCTSGREDRTIVALKDPNAKEVERIDFVFVKGTKKCAVVFDSPDDANGNGLGTALFGAEPAVDGPGGLVWTSDHTGVGADIACAATKKG
ncbi:MAG TPA: endonuclease/exonuclease/phosphatase family protein [Acidimicrobiia bacterium]|nr:endonuclease/exonuclease/phosphatase family protein [Acidimicrobiia bacterium]